MRTPIRAFRESQITNFLHLLVYRTRNSYARITTTGVLRKSKTCVALKPEQYCLVWCPTSLYWRSTPVNLPQSHFCHRKVKIQISHEALVRASNSAPCKQATRSEGLGRSRATTCKPTPADLLSSRRVSLPWNLPMEKLTAQPYSICLLNIHPTLFLLFWTLLNAPPNRVFWGPKLICLPPMLQPIRAPLLSDVVDGPLCLQECWLHQARRS